MCEVYSICIYYLSIFLSIYLSIYLELLFPMLLARDRSVLAPRHNHWMGQTKLDLHQTFVSLKAV